MAPFWIRIRGSGSGFELFQLASLSILKKKKSVKIFVKELFFKIKTYSICSSYIFNCVDPDPQQCEQVTSESFINFPDYGYTVYSIQGQVCGGIHKKFPPTVTSSNEAKKKQRQMWD